MIELALWIYFLIAFFGFLGWQRGWTKEIISTAGIVLGLFALFQFDDVIRGQLLANLPADQRFYLQSLIFLVIVFFAYQQRALGEEDSNNRRRRRRRGGGEGRDITQSRLLGLLTGGFNGYLIGGSLWYFLDINRGPTGAYSLAPYVTAPPAGSTSATLLQNVPMYLLTENGQGDLLALMVIGLFIVVLALI